MGNLVISNSILEQAQISPAELRLEIAVYLYAKERLSIDQARRLAGLDLVSFQKELVKRDIYIHHDKEDLKTDIESLQPPSESKGQPHFLADVIGIMADESGEELERIVSREFQQIEGEW
ncbi:MAG: UPF0175 family protein [Saprospiraceae bacterium]